MGELDPRRWVIGRVMESAVSQRRDATSSKSWTGASHWPPLRTLISTPACRRVETNGRRCRRMQPQRARRFHRSVLTSHIVDGICHRVRIDVQPNLTFPFSLMQARGLMVSLTTEIAMVEWIDVGHDRSRSGSFPRLHIGVGYKIQ